MGKAPGATEASGGAVPAMLDICDVTGERTTDRLIDGLTEWLTDCLVD